MGASQEKRDYFGQVEERNKDIKWGRERKEREILKGEEDRCMREMFKSVGEVERGGKEGRKRQEKEDREVGKIGRDKEEKGKNVVREKK
jgi:hypothetical protein